MVISAHFCQYFTSLAPIPNFCPLHSFVRLNSSKSSIVFLDLTLDHYVYNNQIAQKTAKITRNRRLEQVFVNSDPVTHLFPFVFACEIVEPKKLYRFALTKTSTPMSLMMKPP